MGRIISIDLGLKRSGIAVTDPLQIIATSLTSMLTSELIPFLKDYCAKEKVDGMVIGDPVNLDGTRSGMSQAVELFCNIIRKELPQIPIEKFDERYTSKFAERIIRMSVKSQKKRRDKSLTDKISAVLILQNYLESRK